MTHRIVIAILALLAGELRAMTINSRDVQEALAHADLIVDVAINEVGSQSHAQFFTLRLAHARISRVVEARHSHLYRDDVITIETPGGEREDIGVFISGYPRLYKNRHYRLHLNRKPNGNYVIAGWDEGVQSLDANLRTFSRNRTDGSNGEGEGPFLYWDDRAFPIPYFISALSFMGLQDYVTAIDLSFQEWTRRQNAIVDFLPMGCTTKAKNENDGVNSIILVKDDWPFDSAAIAITRNFYVSGNSASAGVILDSDILLNAVDHKFTTTNELGKHDIQNIITHEVGHFIGMGHEVAPADANATMYAVASPNEFIKRTLNSSDLQGLYSAYAGVPISKQPHITEPSCFVYTPGDGKCLATHQRKTSWTGAVEWLFGLIVLVAGARIARKTLA